MKNSHIFILSALSLSLLTACGEDPQENHTNAINTPKKTYLDTPLNTYESRIEAQNIANTIQNPVNTYLDSRIDAIGLAKESIKESNKRSEAQDKAMEALTK